MPRAALSNEAIEAFRQRTIEVAAELFAAHGYEGVTLRKIAARLGVSAMAPYRYFEDKAEIFSEVRTAAFRRFADSQRDAYESSDDTMARLWAMRVAYLQFAFERPNDYRIMFALDQEPEEPSSDLRREGDRSFDYLHRAVAAAVEEGILVGDPLDIAHLLWTQVHGLVSLHLAGKLTLGRTLEQLRNVSTFNLVARPPS